MVAGQARSEYQKHAERVDSQSDMQINREACRQSDKCSSQTSRQIVRNAGMLPGRVCWTLRHTVAYRDVDKSCEGRSGQKAAHTQAQRWTDGFY